MNLGAHAGHDIVGVQRAIHDDDGVDHVVVMIAAGLAEPRHVADRDFGDVFDEDRHAVRLAERDILDVLDIVALRQIRGAAGIHEADAADIHRLLAEIDGAAADIDIGVAERGDHLRQRDVVGVEFVQIDLDVIFLGGAAPGIHLHDARNGEEPALQDPILHGAEIGQAEIRRPDHLIAVDLADEAGALDLRRDVVRQADILLQIDRGLRQREIIIDIILEHDADERQPVERGRANDVDAGRGGEPDLDRDGEIALHFLGRLAGRLGGNLQDHRRRIWIGLDVQAGKREQAGDDEEKQAEQDERPPGQPECEQPLEHEPSPSPGFAPRIGTLNFERGFGTALYEILRAPR